VETFGVFLLPAGIFAACVVLYALFWAIARIREDS